VTNAARLIPRLTEPGLRAPSPPIKTLTADEVLARLEHYAANARSETHPFTTRRGPSFITTLGSLAGIVLGVAVAVVMFAALDVGPAVLLTASLAVLNSTLHPGRQAVARAFIVGLVVGAVVALTS
jgi:hypothetical protein